MDDVADVGAGADTGGPPRFDGDFRARFASLLRWRRDVRRFRTDPLPPGTAERLVEAAALAPSVGFCQPWRFVRVDHPDRRAAVRDSFLACNRAALESYDDERRRLYAQLKLEGMDRAPLQIAVFADEVTGVGRGLGRRTMPETLRYSAVLAVHTLWLAARVEGIGVGWVSILDPEAVTHALDVPAGWSLIAYLCIGYPEVESDRPELQRAGWEQPDGAARTILQR
ncbi:5,6-dimethylbenzimidazole synthase [Azospirillum fermentarium]|uniref:5,6-dimethylbenzimidazole synthase n=1 Tax=Azospirillum fermentarium TaxID=1233114 RepID=UPI00222690E4|nr:5,6-dimethylbenzimidazole synthase [Azospirillum fermentarium]MCW2245435.1 5,6-dimethylbenzimidazole synthase [Azospirillum fermentarium]